MLSQQTAIVNNDALVIAGGAWCLLVAVELTRVERWRWWPLVAGLALGVAMLGKPQALVFAPLLAIAWLIGTWRRGLGAAPLRRRLLDGALAAVGVGVTYGVWWALAIAFDYPGVGIVPGQPGPGRALSDFVHLLRQHDFLAMRRTWIREFWGQFSWIDVSYADWVYRVILVAVLAGIALVVVWGARTLVRVLRRSTWRTLDIDDGDAAAVVFVAAIAGTFVELYLLAFQYFQHTGRNDFLQGRYALMVVPAVLALPVLALRSLFPRLSPVAPLAVIVVAMAVLNVAGLGVLVENFYL
jgi:hypothetical protein